MAVPDTDDFTLKDVTTELFGDTNTGRGLQECFANANANAFDPAYAGSKDRLSNFRNYGSGFRFVDNTAISVAAPNLTTNSVQYLPNILAGDFLILCFLLKQGQNNGTGTIPSGWTNLRVSNSRGNGVVVICYKIATGGETGSVVLNHTFSNNNGSGIAMFRYRGVDLQSTGNTAGFTTNSINDATTVSPAVGQVNCHMLLLQNSDSISVTSGKFVVDANPTSTSHGGFSFALSTMLGTGASETSWWGWSNSTIKARVYDWRMSG